MKCKRCDQPVKHDEEHYKDGIGEDGQFIWELAGWTCTAIDWNARYHAAKALLIEWQKFPSEPTPGDGLCATEEVLVEQRAWNAQYTDLLARTSAAITETT